MPAVRGGRAVVGQRLARRPVLVNKAECSHGCSVAGDPGRSKRRITASFVALLLVGGGARRGLAGDEVADGRTVVDTVAYPSR